MANSIWQGLGLTEVFVMMVTALSSYLVQRYLLDPLRKIPGPRGLPFIGNLLMLQPERMHLQLSDLAKQYGSVLKIRIFNKTIVVLNSADVCIEALTKKGTDFLGRPPLPRQTYLIGPDVSLMTFDHPSYPLLRRVSTKALKAYGTGMAHLEKIMQDVIQDSIEILNSKDGQPVDTYQLGSGYVCSVMVSILYGEVRTFEDPICRALSEMNRRVVQLGNPASGSAIMDIFPVLFKFRRFLFNDTYHFLEETKEMIDERISKRLQEAKETYDKNHKRGCVDYFIESQKEEVDYDGNQILSDSEIQGLLIDFTVAALIQNAPTRPSTSV